MRFERLVLSLFASAPAEAAAFYVRHLGMRVDVDLGWFISLRHDDHADLEIAISSADHESIPISHRRPANGLAVALVVDDVDAQHQLFMEFGTPIVQPPTDHPWGQRQLLAQGPDGVLIDLVQFTTPDPAWLAANGLTADA